MTPRPRLHHLRTAEGRHEIDIIIEVGARRLVAIEVKATSSPGPDDARHLRWLKRELGDSVIASVLLHSGPNSFEMDEGDSDELSAMDPISTVRTVLSATPDIRVAVGETSGVAASTLRMPELAVTSWFSNSETPRRCGNGRLNSPNDHPTKTSLFLTERRFPALGTGACWPTGLDDGAA
jgi:hypothetical protein